MNNKSHTLKEAAERTRTPKVRFPEFREAEGWKETELLTIARPVSERAINGDGDEVLSLSGEHGIVLQSDYFGKKVAGDNSERYIKIARNDFVYNDRTTKQSIYGTIKRLSKYEGGIVSPIYKCFRFNGNENPVFWDWYFESGVHESELRGLVNEGARAGRFNISIDRFLSTNVGHPSLPEQQKIAECLTSLDEVIDAHGQKLDALKTHKQRLAQQLFPREDEAVPRHRFPEFRDVDSWTRKTLNDIAEISSGTTPPRSNPEFFDGGTIPWVKTMDLNNSLITETEEKITPKARARVNPAGSVLVAMYGGFNQIGRTGCLSVPAATNQAISVLVVDKRVALPVYVLAWLNAKVDDWKRIASSSRKDPNITGSDVANFRISLPEIQEQQKIADSFASLDDLIAAETQKLDALKTHKKGLMQQLFPSAEEVDA